ncbi:MULTISPECIES: hypothetical protein [Flammeovirga]|uniref:Uncharacterized protein n=1 Tax=Flammeovirga agarivorans TaxID=2726742 RepID=A0A7X8SIA4_9BACT|nr:MULTISPECIES: hypothetical protein [Flammeovirga]NLR90746.1 hypothetical protein [Flammeovirga agarivorans]
MMNSQNFFNTLSNRRKIVIGLVITLLTLNLLQLFMRSGEESRLSDRVQSKNFELVLTYAKLDSISTELNKQIQILTHMNEDITSLEHVRDSLESEKKELRSAQLLQEKRYHSIRSKVSVYEEFLNEKNTEITSLKHVNDSLISENSHLKQEKTDLKSKIDNLRNQQGELEKELDAAKILTAYDFTSFITDQKGNIIKGDAYKAKKVNDITVQFKLARNSLSESERKIAYMCLVDPDGATIYNAINETRSFSLANSEEKIFYTVRSTFDYDNQDGSLVQITYSNKSFLAKGLYTAKVFCEGYQLGKIQFSIQ